MPIFRLALFYYVADGLALNQNERRFARPFAGITGAKKMGIRCAESGKNINVTAIYAGSGRKASRKDRRPCC
ncbi:hypothetical protein [Heyndrickxia coagulans]|uniref:hypothetical protein n=1 Tax=Heyndrickxia coagulans TaxID=1398 RepID=UPI0002DCBE06|nr:hypothetical protein [Heyndrickxia coagulans]MCR2846218.1 hypothetical protein [Heyndrickxia coagulans]MDR4224387.1 hypothetical protein [Heyndrickxia coagulans DSM 1 = ATCC 7050]